MEHFLRHALIAQKWLNTAITSCKQLQVIALVLVCRCGMWVSGYRHQVGQLQKYEKNQNGEWVSKQD
jgi:hypothetical protein